MQTPQNKDTTTMMMDDNKEEITPKSDAEEGGEEEENADEDAEDDDDNVVEVEQKEIDAENNTRESDIDDDDEETETEDDDDEDESKSLIEYTKSKLSADKKQQQQQKNVTVPTEDDEIDKAHAASTSTSTSTSSSSSSSLPSSKPRGGHGFGSIREHGMPFFRHYTEYAPLFIGRIRDQKESALSQTQLLQQIVDAHYEDWKVANKQYTEIVKSKTHSADELKQLRDQKEKLLKRYYAADEERKNHIESNDKPFRRKPADLAKRLRAISTHVKRLEAGDLKHTSIEKVEVENSVVQSVGDMLIRIVQSFAAEADQLIRERRMEESLEDDEHVREYRLSTAIQSLAQRNSYYADLFRSAITKVATAAAGASPVDSDNNEKQKTLKARFIKLSDITSDVYLKLVTENPLYVKILQTKESDITSVEMKWFVDRLRDLQSGKQTISRSRIYDASSSDENNIQRVLDSVEYFLRVFLPQYTSYGHSFTNGRYVREFLEKCHSAYLLITGDQKALAEYLAAHKQPYRSSVEDREHHEFYIIAEYFHLQNGFIEERFSKMHSVLNNVANNIACRELLAPRKGKRGFQVEEQEKRDAKMERRDRRATLPHAVNFIRVPWKADLPPSSKPLKVDEEDEEDSKIFGGLLSIKAGRVFSEESSSENGLHFKDRAILGNRYTYLRGESGKPFYLYGENGKLVSDISEELCNMALMYGLYCTKDSVFFLGICVGMGNDGMKSKTRYWFAANKVRSSDTTTPLQPIRLELVSVPSIATTSTSTSVYSAAQPTVVSSTSTTTTTTTTTTIAVPPSVTTVTHATVCAVPLPTPVTDRMKTEALKRNAVGEHAEAPTAKRVKLTTVVTTVDLTGDDD